MQICELSKEWPNCTCGLHNVMPKTIRVEYDDKICPDCLGPIAIRNPSGHCDHLYYPEYKTKSSRVSSEETKKYDKDIYKT